MRLYPNRGSHLPVLIKLMQMTTGSVLELGSGVYSTSYLHWACYPTDRRLVTYEGNEDYFGFVTKYARSFHEVHCINDWDTIDVSEPWSIAFVDHSPAKRRGAEVKKLLHADYIVAHDTENANAKHYRYNTVYKLFKYRWKFHDVFPHTSVWSNKYDVTNFSIE